MFEDVLVTERVLWWSARPVEPFEKGHESQLPKSEGCSSWTGAGCRPAGWPVGGGDVGAAPPVAKSTLPFVGRHR